MKPAKLTSMEEMKEKVIELERDCRRQPELLGWGRKETSKHYIVLVQLCNSIAIQCLQRKLSPEAFFFLQKAGNAHTSLCNLNSAFKMWEDKALSLCLCSFMYLHKDITVGVGQLPDSLEMISHAQVILLTQKQYGNKSSPAIEIAINVLTFIVLWSCSHISTAQVYIDAAVETLNSILGILQTEQLEGFYLVIVMCLATAKLMREGKEAALLECQLALRQLEMQEITDALYSFNDKLGRHEMYQYMPRTVGSFKPAAGKINKLSPAFPEMNELLEIDNSELLPTLFDDEFLFLYSVHILRHMISKAGHAEVPKLSVSTSSNQSYLAEDEATIDSPPDLDKPHAKLFKIVFQKHVKPIPEPPSSFYRKVGSKIVALPQQPEPRSVPSPKRTTKNDFQDYNALREILHPSSHSNRRSHIRHGSEAREKPSGLKAMTSRLNISVDRRTRRPRMALPSLVNPPQHIMVEFSPQRQAPDISVQLLPFAADHKVMSNKTPLLRQRVPQRRIFREDEML